MEHLSQTKGCAWHGFGNGEAYKFFRAGNVVDNFHHLGYFHSSWHDTHSCDYFGGIKHIHVEVHYHFRGRALAKPLAYGIAVWSHIFGRQVLDAILCLPPLDFVTFPVTEAHHKYSRRVYASRQKTHYFVITISHAGSHCHCVIPCIWVTRQSDVGVRINPYHCHISTVTVGKISEWHHACGTFAAKRDNAVGAFRIEYVECSTGLCQDCFSVGNAVGRNAFCYISAYRHSKHRLPTARSKTLALEGLRKRTEKS